MPITVDAPDGSQVEFPDSMQPEEIEGVLSKQFPNKDKVRKSLQDEMSKLRFQGFLGEQEQAALGAAENIAKVAAIPATPILKLPRSEGTGVGAGLLNVGAGLAEGLSAPAYWMLPGSKPLQALTAGQIAGNIPESTVNALQTFRNPQATTAQKVEAGAQPLLGAATAGLLSGAIRLPRRAAPETFPEIQDPREVARQATLPSQEPFPAAAKVEAEPIPEATPPSVEPVGESPIRLVGEKKTAPWPDALVSKSPTGEGWRLTWFSRFENKLDPRGHDDFPTREAAMKAAKEMDFEEVPPSGQSGEATPAEAPAVSEAVQEGVAAPPEEPAITETTTEPKVGQAPTVTPEVTEPISEGPGAASPGDVPMGSQLSQLTQTIQRQISPAEPLMDRIKSAVNVADKWAKTKDSATQGIAKVRAASQALFDGYLHLPPWRDFDESVGKWTGADQETALQVRQFQKQIMKAIPSRLRQEAITNWIQADGDEAVLRERAAASKPSVRRGYELALQLNEGEKTLARNVSQYLDARLKEGLANGLLKQGVDNYVTQIWRRPTSATQKLWADLFGTGALNPNFKFARRRIFDSYFEGEQAGYIPKNKTIGNLISQYDLAFNRALSGRALIKQLQEGKAGDGMPITMTSGKTTPVGNPEEIPEAYLIKPNQPPTGAVSGDGRPYRPIDHWALRDWKWATKGPQGQNVFVQGDMLVHPDYYTRLNNALKTSRLRQPEGIGLVTGPLLKGAAILKQTKLSLSPFHTVQEGVHAMAHRVNPFAPAEIDLADPVQKGLVDHGLMVQDPRAHELFAEGSSGGGLIGKIPGLGRLQEAYTDLTFRDYIPKLKMEMAKDAFDRNMKAYSKQIASGKVTPDQIMALTARESNAAFGEQNYKMMGRSPNVQDVLRLGLLAPDFLESRFRFVAQALKPYGREQRIALALMFGTLYVASRVINKAADDDYHWDKPFSVFVNGREYRLRTVLGDVQHLITDPRSFWYNRLSPVSRTVSEYITGRDDRGIKRSSAEQFVDFLSWFKPIPTQIRSDQTLGQAALAATGIPSKSYTKSQQVYELVDNWMKASKDPKVQERYQRLRQETLPDSPYRPLRDALKRDDLKAAKAEYLKLRQSRNDSVISEAMRQNRPFTGSLQSENKFKASLSEEQRRLYEQALQERKDTYQKFLRAKGVK